MLLFCSSGGLGSWESDDDADMDDEDSMVTALGCLGPLGGLLAPELQRYQKHLKGQSRHMNYYTVISTAAGGESTETAAKWLESNYCPKSSCSASSLTPITNCL